MGRREALGMTATIVLVLLAIGLTLLYYRYAEHPPRPDDARFNVLVASEPIPAGTTVEEAVNANRLHLASIPEEDVAGAAIGAIEPIEGQVALVDIAPGQQLLTTMFGED